MECQWHQTNHLRARLHISDIVFKSFSNNLPGALSQGGPWPWEFYFLFEEKLKLSESSTSLMTSLQSWGFTDLMSKQYMQHVKHFCLFDSWTSGSGSLPHYDAGSHYETFTVTYFPRFSHFACKLERVKSCCKDADRRLSHVVTFCRLPLSSWLVFQTLFLHYPIPRSSHSPSYVIFLCLSFVCLCLRSTQSGLYSLGFKMKG